jgi:hypothetical protein
MAGTETWKTVEGERKAMAGRHEALRESYTTGRVRGARRGRGTYLGHSAGTEAIAHPCPVPDQAAVIALRTHP